MSIIATNLLAAAAAVLAMQLLAPGSRPVTDSWSFDLILGHAVAAGVALALGMLLSRYIVGPIEDLARVLEAAERRPLDPTRETLRLPDLSSRNDEIGHLSCAMQRLIAALFDRIAATEDFATDVSHEVRNPLASLRSAAEALRRAEGEGHDRLLDIIEQDVARLDRLVGEISTASRLDAELVREQAIEFDIIAMVGDLVSHLSPGAARKGIEVIADLPEGPIQVVGLEARLAQVVVNLFDNAVSLCEEGDAIRIWIRRRAARLLVVVEDTGPGISEGAAEKIFRRFYTERPEAQFGGNSGLGLAISRQIVEAHDGVIWAENIRPTERDLLSEPLGARFIFVLPL